MWGQIRVPETKTDVIDSDEVLDSRRGLSRIVVLKENEEEEDGEGKEEGERREDFNP